MFSITQLVIVVFVTLPETGVVLIATPFPPAVLFEITQLSMVAVALYKYIAPGALAAVFSMNLEQIMFTFAALKYAAAPLFALLPLNIEFEISTVNPSAWDEVAMVIAPQEPLSIL